jgi:8-oxo-dGTP diphosphatase
MTGQYPNSFYRVSVKAIIRDHSGKILVVKEGDSEWSLPGGGMDHGETVHDALKRELYEELRIDSDFGELFVGEESTYLEEKDAWVMWLGFEISVPPFDYTFDGDVHALQFVDPNKYIDSKNFEELFTYRLATKKSSHF